MFRNTKNKPMKNEQKFMVLMHLLKTLPMEEVIHYDVGDCFEFIERGKDTAYFVQVVKVQRVESKNLTFYYVNKAFAD